MIQSMLTKESPEIIRFFRNIESLSEILDTQAEKMRPVLNLSLIHISEPTRRS